MNNIAQLVECVHVVHDSVRLIDEIVDSDQTVLAEFEPRAGQGVGAVEVPRGILYHHYHYDSEGYLEKANCIIPTTQNNLNIHLDLRELAEHLAAQGVGDKQLELMCSMLVRAYDPCISCSVH
jgi:coenzyme F420-reducing hydrogenase alpha subunit